MEHIPFQTSWVLGWLFDSSICISILICLILTIKAVTKGRLPAWWSYGLWLLLLLRMLMPWGIESRISVFNYLPAPLENESYMPFLMGHDVSIPLIQDNFDIAKTPPAPTSTDADLVKEPANRYHNSKESNRSHFNLSLDNALLILWFTGVMLFGIRTLFKNFVFWLTIRRLPSAKDKDFLDIFEKCRLSVAIRKNIAVIVTDKVKSPALFGFFRPRLLLPPHFFDTLQRDELRYVFLHELSHLKRHDIVVSWLVTALQIIHWFNPFVWYAFYHLRVDQEAACDAYVLSRIKQIRPADYANTIVSLLERFIQNRQLPSLVGIIEDRSQIRRRIAMIMNFKRYTLQTKCALILMLFVVGLIFLTGSSDKADANKAENAVVNKEIQLNRSIDEKVSSRYENRVSSSEDEKDLNEEIDIVSSKETAKNIGMKEETEINLAKLDSESVKTQGDPLILSAKDNQEIISGNETPEIEEPAFKPRIEHSEAVQQRQDSPDDNTSRGISHLKEPSALPEKYNLDNELESVDQIFTIKAPRCQEVDNQSIILRVNWRDYYLLVLHRPIDKRYSNPSIGISRTVSTITRGIDRVYVEPSGSTTGFVIDKIYKLKGKEHAREIKERLREDAEKLQDSSADYTSLGLSHLEKEQTDDAISDFNEAIELNPGNSVAYFSRGRAYYKQGKIENAISDYNKAIEISPEFTAAYQSRGYAYYSLDDYAKAISDYDKAIEINSEDAATYNMRGIAYYRQGQTDNAMSDYNKAIEIAPEFAAAYQSRGYVYHSKRKYEEAISDYDKAIEYNPENADAYIYRGHSYYSMGIYHKAISDYDKAIQLNPEAAVAKVAKDYRNRAITISTEAIPEKYKLDNELEVIDEIYTFNRLHLTQVDNQSVILRANWDDYYLLVLRQPIEMVPQRIRDSIGIDVYRGNRKIEPGYDRVIVDDGIKTRKHDIDRIYKLKGREQAKEIKERFGANVEKPKNSSVDETSRGLSHLEKEQIDDAISDFNKAIALNPEDAPVYTVTLYV